MSSATKGIVYYGKQIYCRFEGTFPTDLPEGAVVCMRDAHGILWCDHTYYPMHEHAVPKYLRVLLLLNPI